MAIGDKQGGQRRPQNAVWYLALIVILTAGLVVWAVLSLRVDLFTDALKQEQALSILLVIDDKEKPLMTEMVFFHPLTNNGALIDIPNETGSLLKAVDKVARLESLYDPDDPSLYSASVSDLLNLPVDFTVRMSGEEFEMLVDLVGGIDIFIPNAIDDTVEGTRYLFPPGGVSLDGAKARSYLEYRPVGEVVEERTGREHRIAQGLLASMGENSVKLLSEEVYPYTSGLIHSDMDNKGLSSFIRVLSKLDTSRFVFQGVLGNRRNLDGEMVLFPYYDGKLIKETVQRVRDALGQRDEFGESLLTVRVEILNGTEINGLASRTAQIYQSFGFRIISVTNAERDDYERTVILDRRGNPDATRRVAELIRCDQIHSEIDQNGDETVDVTIILGKDFDGRYVKR